MRFFSRSEDVELARFAAFASGEMFQTRMLLRCGKKGTTTRKVRTTRHKSFEIRRPRKEREKTEEGTRRIRALLISTNSYSAERNKLQITKYVYLQKDKKKRIREREKERRENLTNI